MLIMRMSCIQFTTFRLMGTDRVNGILLLHLSCAEIH
jgi:hypothetical protein